MSAENLRNSEAAVKAHAETVLRELEVAIEDLRKRFPEVGLSGKIMAAVPLHGSAYITLCFVEFGHTWVDQFDRTDDLFRILTEEEIAAIKDRLTKEIVP